MMGLYVYAQGCNESWVLAVTSSSIIFKKHMYGFVVLMWHSYDSIYGLLYFESSCHMYKLNSCCVYFESCDDISLELFHLPTCLSQIIYFNLKARGDPKLSSVIWCLLYVSSFGLYTYKPGNQRKSISLKSGTVTLYRQ